MGLRAVKGQVLQVLIGAGPLPQVPFVPFAPPASLAPFAPFAPRFAAMLADLAVLPRSQVLKVLFSLLCHHDPLLHWRAVSLLGLLVAQLVAEELEAARVVIRRLMWSLNDESGGIGWGAPEALAECLVHHPDLAREYTHILVSFMREDGFYLEYPPLQRGLMWGLGRLAPFHSDLLRARDAGRYLRPYLASVDPEVRGLAARAAGLLRVREAEPDLGQLARQTQPVIFYHQDQLLIATVGQLATAARRDLANRE